MNNSLNVSAVVPNNLDLVGFASLLFGCATTVLGLLMKRRCSCQSQRQADLPLHDIESLLEECQYVTRFGVWDFDAKKQKIFWSKGVFQLFNRDPALGVPSYEACFRQFQPLDAQKFAEVFRFALATGKPFQLVLQVNSTIETHTRFIEATGRTNQDLEGNVVRLYGVLQDVTERVQAENVRLKNETVLQQTEKRFRAFMDHSPVSAWFTDGDGVMLYVSEEYARTFGFEASDVVGKSIFDIFPTETAAFFLVNIRQVVATAMPMEAIETAPGADGTLRYYRVFKFPIFSQSVDMVGGFALDITEEMVAEQRLRESQEQYLSEKELAHTTLQSIGDGVIITNREGVVTIINPVAQAITGWTEGEAIGLSIAEVFSITNQDSGLTVTNPVFQAMASGKVCYLASDTVVTNRNGTVYGIEDSAAPICDKNGLVVGAVLVFRDVTEARFMARELAHYATHDALTGLVNRREFESRLHLAIQSVLDRNDPLSHTLLFIDLDQFKIVNDTCGHAAGNELLKGITDLLLSKIRNTDTVARLGGDEFAILLARCPAAKGFEKATELLSAIRSWRFEWGEQKFFVGASIGLMELDIQTVPTDLSLDKVSEALLAAADAACYRAKDLGRNRIFIAETDGRSANGQLATLPLIIRAFDENRFRLYLQPIVSLKESGKQHYEILLRLQDDNGQILSPAAFLPAAERYNLMPRIDRFVILKFLQLYTESAVDLSHICFAINLSGATINDDEFTNFVREAFVHYGVSPKSVCFEITETEALNSLKSANSLIEELQSLGFIFALDDFGDGYASVNYLRSLKVNRLKIDGTFIRNIATNEVDYAFVAMMHQIGKLMGIETIAEFVEDEAIAEKLRSIGVDYAQGYGFGKPQPWHRSLLAA